MSRCGLCKAKARMYCASDRASLCFDCDAAVHSANFLVARHSRNLLCDACQSPTPWSAAGGKLGHTLSVCEQCAAQERCDESGGEESEAAEEMAKGEEEENQVVPWSPPPPSDESCSSDDESVEGGVVAVSRKRFRIEAERSCTSSRLNTCGGGEVRRRRWGRVNVCGSAAEASTGRNRVVSSRVGLGNG